MTEERAPYHVGQEPAEAQESTHEHLFRVVVGNKLVVRFCERCGRTWLTTELRDILHSNRLSIPGPRCLRRQRRVKN